MGGKVASGSLESTTENIELSNREECQPLEEADDDSQQGLSEISDEDDAEIAARTSKGARSGLKRGRKACFHCLLPQFHRDVHLLVQCSITNLWPGRMSSTTFREFIEPC